MNSNLRKNSGDEANTKKDLFVAVEFIF